MHFEHLVQINDPLMPLLDPLTRAQLWRGLVRRAERPTEFVLALDSCSILGRREHGATTTLERDLDFGPFRVRDTVTLHARGEVSTTAEATERWPRSRLTIRIEEPEREALFLRFIYEWEGDPPGSALDEATLQIRQQAYLSADMDTVQRIRELAAAGLLD